MTNNFKKRAAKGDPVLEAAKRFFPSFWADNPAQGQQIRAELAAHQEHRTYLVDEDGRVSLNPNTQPQGRASTTEAQRDAARNEKQRQADALREQAEQLEAEAYATFDEEDETDEAPIAASSAPEFVPTADEAYNQHMVKQGFTPAGEA